MKTVEQAMKERQILQAQIIKGLTEAKHYIDLDLCEQTKKHLSNLILREIRKNNETGGTF